MDREPKILAIDPGSNCGFAHSDGVHGVWSLLATGSEHSGKRLVRLFNHLTAIHKRHGVDRLVYESSHQMERGQNARVVHGQLVGILLYFAAQHDIPFRDCPLMTLKAFAGSGTASKTDMLQWARTKLGLEVHDDNQADACWLLAWAQAGYPATEPKPRARKPREKKLRQKELISAMIYLTHQIF